MTGDAYQSTWSSIPDNEATVSAVALARLPQNTDEMEAKLAAKCIMTMASGELPNEFKFFLYAQEAASGTMLLIQANVEKSADPLLILTIKSNAPEAAKNALVEILSSAVN